MKKLRLLFLCFLAALSISVNAIIQQGSCGDNVTFVLNDDGTLVISGTGAMENYSYSSTPWYSNRSKIQEVIINNGVESIGNYAFYNCTGLTSVTIPNSVTNIGNRSFSGCSNLTSITIPNSVTSIGQNAFFLVNNIVYNGSASGAPWDAKSLNGYVDGYFVYRDDTKKELTGCSSIVTGEMNIPESVEIIGKYAFGNCTGFTSVTIPNSVTSIGISAFEGCSGLTSITIPNSVKIIERNAFCDCLNLTSINIPNSVTSIGTGIFTGCSKLLSVTIPNSITSIGAGTFAYCAHLTSVTIPNSVTSIGSEAFWFCFDLDELTCFAKEVPEMGFDVFSTSKYFSGTLYVPAESVEAYKAADQWKDWGNILPIPTSTITIYDNVNEFTNNTEQNSTIEYIRNFSNTNWQALYVPFAMSYDDWKNDFEVAYINNVNQYDYDEDGAIDKTKVEIIKLKDGKSIEPNTPYLIKAKTTGEKTITLENATLYKAEEKMYDVTSWFTRFNFIGTYHTITDMAENGYYAMAGGILKQATNNAATLSPFRWYLSVTDRNGNAVDLNTKSINLVFDDGETTDIEQMENAEVENGSIHTLTGIKKGDSMKSLAPGMYIKNGKKFIVK